MHDDNLYIHASVLERIPTQERIVFLGRILIERTAVGITKDWRIGITKDGELYLWMKL